MIAGLDSETRQRACDSRYLASATLERSGRGVFDEASKSVQSEHALPAHAALLRKKVCRALSRSEVAGIARNAPLPLLFGRASLHSNILAMAHCGDANLYANVIQIKISSDRAAGRMPKSSPLTVKVSCQNLMRQKEPEVPVLQ